MVVNAYGFIVETEALKGYDKKKFCEDFKGANRKLTRKGKTVADVWEVIKKDIPKVKVEKKVKPKDESSKEVSE